MAVVAWLVLGVLLASVFGLLVTLGRAHEKFCVSVRSGRALLVRGRLPDDAVTALATLVGPSAGSVLVKGYDREGDLVIEVEGASDAVALRIRMRLAEFTPEALDRLPAPQPTWWRVLGFVDLAWWADARLGEESPTGAPKTGAPKTRAASNILPFPRPSYGVTRPDPELRLVIFDLGGVVFFHSFDRALEVWGRHCGVDPQTLKGRYHQDEAYALHEVDALGIEDYCLHVCSALGITLSLEQFVEGWNAIFLDEVPGIRAVLDELAQTVTLVALSNTNRTHCAFMKHRYRDVLSRFSRIYYSHEIGARKPEASAFQRILDDFGIEDHRVDAPQVVFADDLEANLIGARDLGLDTIHVTSAAALVQGLVERGLLVPPNSF